DAADRNRSIDDGAGPQRVGNAPDSVIVHVGKVEVAVGIEGQAHRKAERGADGGPAVSVGILVTVARRARDAANQPGLEIEDADDVVVVIGDNEITAGGIEGQTARPAQAYLCPRDAVFVVARLRRIGVEDGRIVVAVLPRSGNG